MLGEFVHLTAATCSADLRSGGGGGNVVAAEAAAGKVVADPLLSSFV